MKITVTSAKAADVAADLLVAIVDKSRQIYSMKDQTTVQWLETYRKGVEAARIKAPDITQSPRRHAAGALLATAIEMGARKKYPECERVRAVAQEIFKYCESRDKRRIAILLNGPDGPALSAWLAEGFMLGSYTFNDFRDPKKFTGRFAVEFLVEPDALAVTRQSVKAALQLSQCVNFARDLINRPGSIAIPDYLAQEAQTMAAETGMECEVWDEKRLADEKCNGLLTVGKGGLHPPRMIVLRYVPKAVSAQSHLCLLGKGLTFDTGGLCLKSGTSMWEMISDMSGAAAVLGAMRAIADAKPAVRVTGIMVCAQNDVSANAVKPGDCFVARNGKSVHVLNTDAEGRLILSDGLFQAGVEGASHVVDIATLTGACARALGESLSGLFCNDFAFQEIVRRAGEGEGELMWPLPLHQEYRGLLDHYRTDINNTSKSSDGGAITAALFLQEFLPEGIKWAHLDVAGTAFGKSSWRYLGPGARGVMVRTFLRLAQKFAE